MHWFMSQMHGVSVAGSLKGVCDVSQRGGGRPLCFPRSLDEFSSWYNIMSTAGEWAMHILSIVFSDSATKVRR